MNTVKVKLGPCKLLWCTVSGLGRNNYNDDGRYYCATGVVDGKVAQTLIDSVKHLVSKPITTCAIKEYLPRPPNDEGEVEYDLHRICKPSLTLDESKHYGFFFKVPTLYNGEPNRFKIYNKAAAQIQLEKQIANGSTGIIYGTASGYDFKANVGISFRLDALQLIDHIPYTPQEQQ